MLVVLNNVHIIADPIRRYVSRCMNQPLLLGNERPKVEYCQAQPQLQRYLEAEFVIFPSSTPIPALGAEVVISRLFNHLTLNLPEK